MVIRKLFVLSLLLIFAGAAEAGEKIKLNAAELEKRLASYEVLAGVHKDPDSGFYYMVVAFQDGNRDLYWNNGLKSGTDTGTHRFVNDQICVKWNSMFQGQERCYDVYKTGGNKYEDWRNGNVAFSYDKIK